VKPGLLGAVAFGTARRAAQDGMIAGKTGTCTDRRTHMGWFGSYSEDGRKLVVVVMLTGGQPAIGPLAAGIAGQVYRNVAEQPQLAQTPPVLPASLVSTQICCAR
jgi:cell division protein FtsI/penicillin-binding protein 2